jgi:hypothetical protein
MGLMVFLAFISLFVLYWVPVMMEDNEARHMRDVIDQFGRMKENIDDQIALNSEEEKSSLIKLGADGVPMFERETPSELSLRLADESFNLTFQDSGEDIFENSSGSIDLVAYNRFYVKQTIIYENGAILISQKKGDSLKFEPNLLVELEGSNVKLTMTMISLLSDTDESIAGISTEGITTRVWYTDRWTYTNITSINNRITLTISSNYLDAWQKHYYSTFNNSGLQSGADYNITSASGKLEIIIDRVSEVSLSHSYLETYIGKAVS